MSDGPLAIIITIVTAAIFLGLGVWYVGRGRLNVEDYIVSRNTAGAGLATATLVASVIGAWILFSPAETGTWAGLAGLIGYGIGQAAPLVAFILLGPRMRKLMPQGHSLTEYVWYRYGSTIYYAFTIGVIIFYMFVFLSAELTGISQAVGLLGGTELWLTAIIVGLITVAYTAYGGMRASLFTDRIQFYLIIPLLIIVFIAAGMALNGFGDVFSKVSQDAPHLLSLSHAPGIEFGITLIIAILAANMFHQGFWQRVYTVRDEHALRRGFAIAGIVVIPVIIVAGLFGIMAVGMGVVENPSVAMFSFVMSVMPTWAVIVVLVLALILVMSSMDTLLNGIASAITSDMARYRPDLAGHSLLRSSRIITVILIFPAIFIASQGYSVLYLFLLADLVAAAALFPLFYGMYSGHFNGTAALLSSIIGLAVGALFFPAPDFTGWNDLPLAGRSVFSFGSALVVSAVVSVVWSMIASRDSASEFEFSQLQENVKLIEG